MTRLGRLTLLCTTVCPSAICRLSPIFSPIPNGTPRLMLSSTDGVGFSITSGLWVQIT